MHILSDALLYPCSPWVHHGPQRVYGVSLVLHGGSEVARNRPWALAPFSAWVGA